MKGGERFDSLIQYWAERAGIPYDLARRQVEAESAFNPKAVSPAGARGLLQLMPLTAREVGVADPSNPDDCLRGGMEYLAKQVANVRLALSAEVPTALVYRLALVSYNAGFGYVRAAMRIVQHSGIPLTWDSFVPAFKAVEFNGKRPRWKESIPYAEKIAPSPPKPEPD